MIPWEARGIFNIRAHRVTTIQVYSYMFTPCIIKKQVSGKIGDIVKKKKTDWKMVEAWKMKDEHYVQFYSGAVGVENTHV